MKEVVNTVGFTFCRDDEMLVETDDETGRMYLFHGDVGGDESFYEALLRNVSEQVGVEVDTSEHVHQGLFEAEETILDIQYFVVTGWEGSIMRPDEDWVSLEADGLAANADREAVEAFKDGSSR